MDEDLISQCFTPLVGLPCWNVHRWHGSLFNLSFGEPSLHVREPTKKLQNRLVALRGQWKLDIYMCAWRIFDANGKIEIAHCESELDVMERAMSFLDGQRLEKPPLWNPTKSKWGFKFDLGGRIVTWAWDGEQEFYPGSAQWRLYEPDHYTLRSDQRGKLTREQYAGST